ncbi:AraC family transcriptional regulator [Cohnella nanjingensis]|uniref:Helix-turn-helix transcriptional regulator n=1 Tax=Cohnella nanjingensis TaxID=1387779 RepID=A0A7X0VIQ4_9BACL|nr:AraC family transcriptional regulator [Cohnella nanjingensis]MBB6675176.1 helix-turn-helix transcriptional regulator [Cohnella nanjingensis]
MQEYEYEYAEFIYYTPGPLDKEGQMWPVRAGRSTAKPNYKVGPKRIECYSLHFVQEGRVRLAYDGKRVDLEKDDVFCLFPGRTYYYSMIPSDSPLRMSWLALDGDRIKPLLALAGLTPERPYVQRRITSRVEESIRRAIQALADVERWKPSVSLELQGLVCGLLAGLLPDTASSPASEPAGWIRECMDFMELHATEGITVQQVAAFAGVHRSYLTHVFADQVGMPPLKYLQKIRMEKAMRLLRESDATITEIALSLGYPNLYSFTRAFKIYFKIPPLTVRTSKSDSS